MKEVFSVHGPFYFVSFIRIFIAGNNNLWHHEKILFILSVPAWLLCVGRIGSGSGKGIFSEQTVCPVQTWR
jgi:hypothetical protein